METLVLTQSREDYIEQNFKEWKTRYKFEDHCDFLVKTMFKLEYEFMNLDENHTRSQKEKLDMIINVKRCLPQSCFIKTSNL